MNWFKNLFGMLSKFFARAAKTAIGVAADSISATAIEVVGGLENSTGLSGKERQNCGYY